MSFSGTAQVLGRRAPARRLARALCFGFLLTSTLPTLAATAAVAAPEADTLDIRRSETTDSQNVLRPDERAQMGSRRLGPDLEPLPFASDDEIVAFLKDAEVIKRKVLSSGSTRPTKVLLEKDGVQANAIFRTVDVASGRGPRSFKDCYHFEVAAYETARLLGLDNVPPAVVRRLDGQMGSMQLWVEGARSETDRIAEGDQHRSMSKILFQKHTMQVFDQLIYNFDRNTGNVLIDGDDKLWMIDHTRTFKSVPSLPERSAVRFVDRDLWQRLQGLDEALLKKHLAPHLEPLQLAALVKRHRLLVQHIESLIEELGEDQVLFDRT